MRDTRVKLAYSVDEACSATSLGRTAVFDLLRRGEIASVKKAYSRAAPEVKCYNG
jgi:hypothetical protein